MADYCGCTIEFPAAALDIPEVHEALYGLESSFCDEPDVTNGVLYVRFDELRWGKPQEVEDALVNNKIPFDRISDSTYEYMGERLMYRPEHGFNEVTLDSSDNPFASIHQIIALQQYKGVELEKKVKGLLETLQPSNFEPIAEMVTNWDGELRAPQRKLATEHGGTLYLYYYKTSHDLVLPDRVLYQHVMTDGTKGKIYRTKLIWVKIGEGQKTFFFDFMEKQFWLEEFEEIVNLSVTAS